MSLLYEFPYFCIYLKFFKIEQERQQKANYFILFFNCGKEIEEYSGLGKKSVTYSLFLSGMLVGFLLLMFQYF